MNAHPIGRAFTEPVRGYTVEDRFYRPIREYIAGFGTLVASGART